MHRDLDACASQLIGDLTRPKPRVFVPLLEDLPVARRFDLGRSRAAGG
jgi:hypothetical protein